MILLSDNNNIQEIIEKSRERVIETTSRNMYLYGVTPSIGRLYGTLFFNNEPMTLDDMKTALKMSKTSMSTSVRTLTDLSMVHKVWKKGERKDLYEAKMDWYQIFFDNIINQWRKITHINLEAINDSLNELHSLLDQLDDTDDNLKKNIQQDIEKLEYASDYYNWLDGLFNKIKSKDIIKPIEPKLE